MTIGIGVLATGTIVKPDTIVMVSDTQGSFGDEFSTPSLYKMFALPEDGLYITAADNLDKAAELVSMIRRNIKALAKREHGTIQDALSELPWIGGAVKTALRGGTGMGTLTISRFFVIHVFLLPATILWLVAIHIYLFRKSHAAGPFSEDPLHPRQRPEPFYPRQLLMDLGFVLALVSALAVLAIVRHVPLGPEANPADTRYLPRPEWYFRPIFEWLRLWTSGEEFGLLVLPTLLLILFVGVPFIDRRRERRPWKRPLAVGAFLFVLSSYVGLGVYSYWQDAHDPAVAAQIRKQQQAEAQYMREPFKPHLTGSLPTAEAPQVNPLVASGESVFQSQGCSGCHGEGGVGTAIAPSVIGIGKKFPPVQLEDMLRNPTPRMKAGGMPPVTVPGQEMKALIAYLDSLE